MLYRATATQAASPYSAELTAIINRANLEGFTLPLARQLTTCDTFIQNLKTAGIWNKQDRIYNFAYNNSPNLVRYSQDLDVTDWSKSNATVTANATLAPDSTNTADKVIEAATSTTHLTSQNIPCVASTNYVLSFYIKAGERTIPFVNFSDNVVGMLRNFNLTTGTVDNNTDTTITPVGNDWYYCTMKRITGVAAVNLTPQFYPQSGTYLGDGVSGFYVWGVQVEFGTVASAYQKTPTTMFQNFSRIDWKNPSTSPLLTINGTLTFHEGGYVGDGSTGYLDTGFIPSTHGINYTLNNAGRTIMVYTATGGNPLEGNSSNNNTMFLTTTANHKINATLALTGGNVNLGGSGMTGIHRDSNTVIRTIKRTTETTGRTQTADILPTVNQLIFRNVSTFSASAISFYMMGASLTLTEGTALRNHYNTYMSGIGLLPNNLA